MILINDIKNKLLSTGEYKNNDFLSKYCNLIISNYNFIPKDTERYKYEKHHILPRSYFVYNLLDIDDNPDNLCFLLFKDHILAHYYLYECSLSAKQIYANSHAVMHLINRTIPLNKLRDEFIKLNLDDYQKLFEDFKLGLHNILSEKCSGELNGRCKVTKQQCQQVKILLNEGKSNKYIAKELNISINIINNIYNGSHWSCNEDGYIAPNYLKYLSRKEEIKQNIPNVIEKRKQIELKKQEKLDKKIQEELEFQIWKSHPHYCKNCGNLMTEYYISNKYGKGIFCSKRCIQSFTAKYCRTEEHKKKLIENKPDCTGKNNPNYGKHFSEEVKEKIRQGNIQYHQGTHWMTNGTKKNQIRPCDEQKYIDAGWWYVRKDLNDK